MKNLITCPQLQEQLNDPKLVLFDAGMLRPGVIGTYSPIAILPNAKRFDIKNELADQSNPLPNTLCDAQQFTYVMQQAGVNNDSLVVVYEDAGLFSAARAWWMLKAMGITTLNCSVAGSKSGLNTGMTYRKIIAKH